MKKLLIPAVTLVLTLILVIACGEATVEEESTSIVPKEITQICEDHNGALAHVYNEFISNNISSLDDIENSAIDYFCHKYPNSGFEQIAKSGYCEGMKIFREYRENVSHLEKPLTGNRSNFSEYIETISDSISIMQKEVLLKIDSIMLNYEHAIAINMLNELKENTIPVFPEEEKDILFIAIEMSIFSSTYWYEHLDEWVDLLKDSTTIAKPSAWFNWWDVGNADVSTAVGLGVTGAIVTIATGGTAGPLVGVGIAAGSAGASAQTAVLQILEHWQTQK